MMADRSPVELSGCRKLRARPKSKKFTNDEWLVNEDDDATGGAVYYMSYGLHEKITTCRFGEQSFVNVMDGYNFNTMYLNRDGFNRPVMVKQKNSLGMKVPDSSFTIAHVTKGVGTNRVVDVIDVNTQMNLQMSMRNYQKYYENRTDNGRLLNVISLEFSHTKLDKKVISPKLVRTIDWVDLFWPKFMKARQMDSTNAMMNMMYPKVQKYCLMSVKGCYTDFHIDFGGTSVWYHILKGEKIFWLIPPTEMNLQLYKQWVLSDKQLTPEKRYTFFGDVVEKCERVTLKPGQTFFIPSGWIHAVYTTEDSLVFGGNFLHVYSVDKQIAVSKIEDAIRVNKKFRYPFFVECHFYVLEGLLNQLVGIVERYESQKKTKHDNSCRPGDEEAIDGFTANKKALLLKNIEEIFHYLHEMPDVRKHVPEHLNKETLMKDINTFYELRQHICGENDKFLREMMKMFCWLRNVIGDLEYVKLTILDEYDCKRSIHAVESGGEEKVIKKYKTIAIKDEESRKKQKSRKRRTRCRKCQACRQEDCGACVYCKDMIKYGGNGRAKQSCIDRQCLQPMLPGNAACVICNVGGFRSTQDKSSDEDSDKKPVPDVQAFDEPLGISDKLMECSVCYEIVHPKCILQEKPEYSNYNIEDNINNDLPNSWKCPKCFTSSTNKQVFHKQRFFKARNKLAEITAESNEADELHNGSESVKLENEVASPSTPPDASLDANGECVMNCDYISDNLSES